MYSKPVRFRPYQPSDFAALYAIEVECFQPPLRFGRPYMREILDNPSGAAWIAEQDERLAGFAIVEFTPHREGILAYIQTIEVAPAHRRHHVATELLNRIEASARQAGASAIWLHVEAGNDPAIRLYRAHGFSLGGRNENYYARGRAADIYSKSLGVKPSAPAP